MTVFTQTTTAVSVLLLLSTMALGQISDDPVAVETLVVAPTEDAVEFTINSTEWVRYTYFDLEGPRVVVDFHNAENALGFWKKEVGHAGVDQVRASFFTDAKREATRLVFDLDEETPYEVIDDGEGQVRVRFGVNDVETMHVAGLDGGDLLANLGIWNGPFEPGLFDDGYTEINLLSDASEDGEAPDVHSIPAEVAEVEVSGIEEREEETAQTVRLDAGGLESALFEVATIDSGEFDLSLAGDRQESSDEASLILASYEPERLAAIPGTVSGVETADVIEADGLVYAAEVIDESVENVEIAESVEVDAEDEIAGPEPHIVEDHQDLSRIPVAAPILTSESETSPVGQDLLASISESAEFEIQAAAPSIVVEALDSREPVGGEAGALAQPARAAVTPRSIAEMVAQTVPVAGIAAAPPPSAFMGQAVEPLETPQYSGEIATFDFRDLDLQDFFRLIGDISGLNVVLDPAVNGTVTLLLRAVPWDQALDVVLRNNNLGYELEGNILRVATRATLQAEEDAARQFREAQELNAPLMTQTFILSYTQSATVSATIQDLLSPRGTIITDARRNALIVTDIPSQFGRVESLVAFLDTPSQQVEIEARLLSASKSFSRDLGTQIGLLVGNNSQNAVTGLPGTGSPFARTPAPSVNVGGAVPLITDFPAGGTSGLSFLLGAGGDILLDTIIQAAEATGTAKLLSRPRVTTQNNMAATVSQGTQIPVQTNVNNTITVTFVDFSLSLTVTPQITDSGTILLTAAIENSSPEFGRSVNGIPSVSSQQASTQVLIPDGGTAVIGGILLDNDSVNISQVPGLGNIPVLGNLFKSTQVIKSTSELLFFITARIKPANPLEFLSETTPEESSQLFGQ